MEPLPAILPDGANTYAGLIVALAPLFMSWAGFAPTPEFNANFANALMGVVTIVGAAYTLYGKLRHQIPTWVKKI